MTDSCFYQGLDRRHILSLSLSLDQSIVSWPNQADSPVHFQQFRSNFHRLRWISSILRVSEERNRKIDEKFEKKIQKTIEVQNKTNSKNEKMIKISHELVITMTNAVTHANAIKINIIDWFQLSCMFLFSKRHFWQWNIDLIRKKPSWSKMKKDNNTIFRNVL